MAAASKAMTQEVRSRICSWKTHREVVHPTAQHPVDRTTRIYRLQLVPVRHSLSFRCRASACNINVHATPSTTWDTAEVEPHEAEAPT
jgi:hypothetical protein